MKSVALLGACAALSFAFSTPVLADEGDPDDGTYTYYVDLSATITEVGSYLVMGNGWYDEDYIPITTPSALAVGGDVDLSFWFDIYEFGLVNLSGSEGIVNDFHLNIGAATFPGGSRELIIGENPIEWGYGFTIAWSYPELYTSIDGRTYSVNFFSSADGLIDIEGVWPEGVWAPSNLSGYAEFFTVDEGPTLFHALAFGQTPKTDPVADVVPEPAAWAMMIVGFGLAGTALRRQRYGSVPAARTNGARLGA